MTITFLTQKKSWYSQRMVKYIHTGVVNQGPISFSLRFNPIYFMQNYTYFKQFYQECLKQNI